jgi:pimeloyl-ACP methyl ester carboxylesterase
VVFATAYAVSPVEAARHYKTRMPGCNLVYVYDAGSRMTEERPEAVASLIADFLERHDLFLVRRESDVIHP